MQRRADIVQGPIIRINPVEIHVADAEYYDTIYAGPSRITNKYRPAANRFGAGESMFGIVDHNVLSTPYSSSWPFNPCSSTIDAYGVPLHPF